MGSLNTGYPHPVMSTPWIDAVRLQPRQSELVEAPISGSTYLEGPAGSGKTTAAVHRALRLLRQAGAQEKLLIIVPQRSLAKPYIGLLERYPDMNPGRINILTLGGLARRTTELFWPLYAGDAGFVDPSSLPSFLTLETATYVLANTISPLLDQGAFEGLAIDRNQLYRQILDNLNKAAIVGFPIEEIGSRLGEAWVGTADQKRIYDDAQRCAIAFRQACLNLNMLDFSLQVEVFFRYVNPSPAFKVYKEQIATHLLADNIEEDVPRTHDLIREWLPGLQSALLVFDTEAGFRRFLGADPRDGYALKAGCPTQIQFDDNLVASDSIMDLGLTLAAHFEKGNVPEVHSGSDALHVGVHHHLPESLEWIADEVAALINRDQVHGHEIAIVSPYLSDSVRFLLGRALDERGVRWIAFRPSRQISQEAAARCVLTIAALAHPGWKQQPTVEDVGRTLGMAIAGLDPVRADLFARILYKPQSTPLWLEPFSQLRGQMQERLTFSLGQRYDTLRTWLINYIESPGMELDHFLRKLFGEILTQPGFGFENDLTGGTVVATLIDSVQKFRRILGENLERNQLNPGSVFLRLVQEGVISAQDIRQSASTNEDAVSIMPAFTFLMINQPVSYQFWMDIGSQGWAERIFQPLTHPYVLNRQWQRGRPWTDEEEMAVRDDIAATVCLGLTRRCRVGVFAVWSEIDERGYEQRGPLLRAIQSSLRAQGVSGGK